jgi:hypothetical protein
MRMMLVFVDESGDAGVQIGKGSSQFFIVTAVIFTDRAAADACDATINQIRRSLKIPDGIEFRFSKNSERVRCAFLDGVKNHDFRYSSAVLDKSKLNSSNQPQESLIEYASKMAFQNVRPYLSNATVVIDGNGERKFRNQISAYLRQQINNEDGQRVIKKIKQASSQGNNLIQLADMICGTVWHAHRHQDDYYRKIVTDRELMVRVWPEW